MLVVQTECLRPQPSGTRCYFIDGYDEPSAENFAMVEFDTTMRLWHVSVSGKGEPPSKERTEEIANMLCPEASGKWTHMPGVANPFVRHLFEITDRRPE